MSVHERIGDYKIDGILGVGGFSHVFSATNEISSERFALKVSQDHSALKKEYKIIQHLSQSPGFPSVFSYGRLQNEHYLVQTLLGENLNYNFNDSVFTLECVCAIGLHLLERLECLHRHDIIHRDIKPSQFLKSFDGNSIYLIDFGMATFYKANGIHKKFRTNCNFIGTVNYASINNHMGFRQSRRDDLESFIFSLVYLARGSLPWKLKGCYNGFKKWKAILNQKLSISEKELFQSLPPEFPALLKYTRKLTYEQKPDYAYMKSLLRKFLSTDQVHLYFDWVEHPHRPHKVVSQIVPGATNITKLKRQLSLIAKRKTKKMQRIERMCKNSDDSKSISSLNKSDYMNNERIHEDKSSKRKLEHSGICYINKSRYSECFNQQKNGGKLKSLLKIQRRSLMVPEDPKKNYICKNLSILTLDLGVKLNNEDEKEKNSNKLEKTNWKGDESVTPKNEAPEFKDRRKLLEKRKSFVDEGRAKEHACEIF